MSESSPGSSWLETVAASVDARGFERPSETIVPARGAATPGSSRLTPGGPALEFSRTLAQGGMGTIRLATQLSLGREVAVKALREDRVDPVFADELLREARVTGCLEHPNIVPVHDIGVDADGRPLVVLKHIVGQSWNDLIADDTAPARFGASGQLAWNLDILMDVINAVRFAHSRGIVHRDLKPDNVMIGSFGEVYLVDWGLAVSVSDDDSGRFTRAADEAGKIAGTPAYMAPEMLGHEGDTLDERTDVYLLGAILFEIVTGRPPHRGAKILEVLQHVRTGEISFPALVPAELVVICRRAMARNPDDRYPSADAMRIDLQTFLAHMGSTRLTEEADRSRAELTAALNTPGSERSHLYNLFGECRFGYRAALAAWPQNPEAREGLSTAIIGLVNRELDLGDDGAAFALLADHDDPPADLLERATSVKAGRQEREARLARFEADRDPLIGGRARLVLAMGVSLGWTALPIALAIADFEARLSTRDFFGGAIASLVVWLITLLAFGFVARESLGKTQFNRLIFASNVAGGVATLFLFALLRALELPSTTGPILAMVIWATTAAVVAVTLEPRTFFVVASWCVAAAIAAVEPSWRYYLMAGANLIVAVVVLWAWAPGVRDAYAAAEPEPDERES